MTLLAVTTNKYQKETIQILRNIQEYYIYQALQPDVELFNYHKGKFFHISTNYLWFVYLL